MILNPHWKTFVNTMFPVIKDKNQDKSPIIKSFLSKLIFFLIRNYSDDYIYYGIWLIFHFQNNKCSGNYNLILSGEKKKMKK